MAPATWCSFTFSIPHSSLIRWAWQYVFSFVWPRVNMVMLAQKISIAYKTFFLPWSIHLPPRMSSILQIKPAKTDYWRALFCLLCILNHKDTPQTRWDSSADKNFACVQSRVAESVFGGPQPACCPRQIQPNITRKTHNSHLIKVFIMYMIISLHLICNSAVHPLMQKCDNKFHLLQGAVANLIWSDIFFCWDNQQGKYQKNILYFLMSFLSKAPCQIQN